ncbi:MAG: glutaminyl-peptide cyclotransferase [Phycisphaerales bacterium]|nr:glutaminyl-peptide cyclotransferase [Phycisphaerales bacterium]
MSKIVNGIGLVFIFFLLILTACREGQQTKSGDINAKKCQPIASINYQLVNTYSHDTNLFTEGFFIQDGQLYESTGSPDETIKSMIGITDLKTGKFQKKIELDNKIYFGEGVCALEGKLYQMTYKNQQGFVYDLKRFKQIATFAYSNAEGWGMTTDGKNLIMSDGTDVITYWNPTDLKPMKTLKVTGNGVPQNYLNELEFIKGYIYANIWMSNVIVKINPTSGIIVGQVDLSPLVYDAKTKSVNAEVLNGIAYDAATDKIYVTGKFWKNIYEVKFDH